MRPRQDEQRDRLVALSQRYDQAELARRLIVEPELPGLDVNDPTYRTIADVFRTCRLLVTDAEAIKTLAEYIEHAATIPDLADEIQHARVMQPTERPGSTPFKHSARPTSRC